tara:strand:- start:9117 stop:10298 length:1182 start_codon:yes stop_codon:yes gene_type:complete
MGVRAFHPGLGSTIGVRSRQPRRRVLEVDDRNPEAGSLDAPLLSAQSPAPQVDPTAYSGGAAWQPQHGADFGGLTTNPGDGWRDRFSDFLKSRVGQLLESGSLPELQRGVAEQLTGLAMPPTPGGQMAAPGVAGYVEGALDLSRPLALADLGVGGVGGMMMLPFPGLGAADDAARPVIKVGRGLLDDAAQATSQVAKVADDTPRPVIRMGRSQGFLGDARLAPTRDIGKGVTVSEMATTGDLVDRPFVIVRLPDGRLQPFYRSSGFMSKLEGEWFPFDGFGPSAEDLASGRAPEGWYRKDPYTQGVYAAGTPEHRYGPYREVSELLSRELGDAEPTVLFDLQKLSHNDLNRALGTHITWDEYERAIREQIEAGATAANMPNPMRFEDYGRAIR